MFTRRRQTIVHALKMTYCDPREIPRSAGKSAELRNDAVKGCSKNVRPGGHKRCHPEVPAFSPADEGSGVQRHWSMFTRPRQIIVYALKNDLLRVRARFPFDSLPASRQSFRAGSRSAGKSAELRNDAAKRLVLSKRQECMSPNSFMFTS